MKEADRSKKHLNHVRYGSASEYKSKPLPFVATLSIETLTGIPNHMSLYAVNPFIYM